MAALPAGVPVVRVDASTLGNLARDGGGSHQGVVAAVPPLSPPVVADVHAWATALNAASPLVVALDEISDPHNLGACLRSAWLMGVDGVIMSQRNCAPLSPVACRASAGALEYMAAGPHPRIAVIRNLAASLHALPQVQQPQDSQQQLQQQQQNGGALEWRVMAAAAASGAAVPVWTPGQLGRRPGVGQVIVLGSEGRGVRALVAGACKSGVVAIPHAATRASPLDHVGGVDSLNVSVAAGILMFHAHQWRPREGA